MSGTKHLCLQGCIQFKIAYFHGAQYIPAWHHLGHRLLLRLLRQLLYSKVKHCNFCSSGLSSRIFVLLLKFGPMFSRLQTALKFSLNWKHRTLNNKYDISPDKDVSFLINIIPCLSGGKFLESHKLFIALQKVSRDEIPVTNSTKQSPSCLFWLFFLTHTFQSLNLLSWHSFLWLRFSFFLKTASLWRKGEGLTCNRN